jgi:predicted oxidoreductase
MQNPAPPSSTPLLSPVIRMSPQGPEVSRVVAGMWRMGEWGMSVEQRVRFVEQCLDLGVFTFDHANIYGAGAVETLFGEALAAAPALKKRVQIITKCGIEFPGFDGGTARMKHYDLSGGRIAACVDLSLKKLGVEQVELLLIHRPSPLMDLDAIGAAFGALHAAGKVRHFGVSNFSSLQFDALHRRFPLVTNQIELSPLHLQPMEDGTLDHLQGLGVAPMLWSALGGGALFQPTAPHAVQALAAFTQLGLELGLSPAGAVYAWLMKLPSRPVPLTGSGRIAAIADAVAASKVEMDLQRWFDVLQVLRGQEVP